MKEKIDVWLIPLITLWLYTITILFQYSYNNFFDIPRTFIQSSLVANVTFFWNIFVAIPLSAKLYPCGFVIFVCVVVLLCFTYLWLRKKWKWVTPLAIIILVVSVLGYSCILGTESAKNTGTYYSFNKDCPETFFKKDTHYIIPITYEGLAILVALDKNNTRLHQIKVVDLAETSCSLVWATTTVPIK